MSDWTIREATPDDMAGVARVYEPQVLYRTATFEEVPPSAQDMRDRLKAVQDAGLAWLVAERAGQIIGYAYAGPHRPRAAYRYTIETSVYLDDTAQGQGLGKALMQTLLDRVAHPPIREVIAIVGGSDNLASIRLHESLGFDHVGTMIGVGFKFGRPIDTVIMQKRILQKSV